MAESLSLSTIDHNDLEELADACQVSTNDIVDVYYCTHLQQTLIAATERYSDAYCYRGSWILTPPVDADRFLEAVAKVAEQNSILRTRIADSTTHGLVQVVLRNAEPIDRSFDDYDTYLEHDRSQHLGLGTPLARWGLIGRTLHLTTHHAAYDSTSIKLMMKDCLNIYHGQSPTARAPFRQFVEHCVNVDEEAAEAFWRPRFSHMAAIFPKVEAGYIPRATHMIKHRWNLPEGSKTPASQLPYLIEAAWAHASSIYTHQPAVAYGLVLTGRTSQLGVIGATLGPTIATIPVQANVNPESTIKELIKERAKERRQAFSHAALQYGSSRIRTLSVEASRASQFATVLDITMSPFAAMPNEELLQVTEHEGNWISALVLRILIQDGEIVVNANFDPNVICERQLWRIMHQLDHSVQLFLDGPQDRKLKELATISAADWEEVFRWNETLPKPTQQCLHEIFQDRARLHASRKAVEAWDQNATYEDLDMLSTQLALQLIGCGIEPGASVLVHCGRCCWAIICILAVMKAGACCIPLDPARSQSDKETIAAASKAEFMVTLKSSGDVNGLVETIIVADGNLLGDECESSDLPAVSANQLAYILYGSDSIGPPEGVMLEHQSIATSLTSLGTSLEWNSKTRGLQFASLDCDASLVEYFGPLLFGGCVCIPSTDKRDNNLAAYIVSKKVSQAQLTPLVLRSLSPQTCPTLKTIQLVGEPIDPKAASAWSGVRLVNSWGVSEASMQSSLHVIEADSPYSYSIGRPLGCALWIVDPETTHKLVPIGAIGELVIEGSTVARGYLEDEAKTAESFIRAPLWAPLRTLKRRFYRTGDLARFLPDGNIEYLGRRNHEVRIWGQRFQLEEVEAAILSCEAVREVIVATLKSGHHKDLVAVLSLGDDTLPHEEQLRDLDCEASRQALVAIRKHVKQVLPAHMVPKYWIAVENLVHTINAKTNRIAINEWLESRELTSADLAVTEDDSPITAPTSDAERAFRDVCASVLRVAAPQVDYRRSFLDLGGNSISAMQVAARLLRRGYQTTIAALLESQSLQEVASRAEYIQQPVRAREGPPQEQQLEIGPGQKLLLERTDPVSGSQFSRSWLLELRCAARPAEVEAALVRLVEHHAVLRTTFVTQSDGAWTSKVLEATNNVLHFEHLQSLDESALRETVEEMQRSLDMSNGPVFGAKLIDLADERRVILLTAHQLSVDFASGDIIRKQLDQILTDSEAELPQNASFGLWTERLRTFQTTSDTAAWPRADHEFWRISDQPALNRDRTITRFKLDHETSHLLLHSANDAFKTAPTELLLAAVWMSFQQSFPDRGSPAFTVGCFMVLSPMILAGEASTYSIEHVVPAVKYSYLQTSHSAAESFAKTMFGASPLRLHDVEIWFNFQGQTTQVEQDGGILNLLPVSLGLEQAVGAEQRGVITIDVAVLDDCIHFSFNWNNQMAHQDRLKNWVVQLEEKLEEMTKLLRNRPTSLTKTETPLLGFDEPEQVEQAIKKLGLSTDDIETVHPVSAIQEGILLAQRTAAADVSMSQALFKLEPAGNHSIDMDRLEQAWIAVCQAHPMLRTIFAEGISATTTFVQIILKEAKPTIGHLKSDDDEDTWNVNRVGEPTDPPHYLQLRTLPDTGEVHVVLDISPSLADVAAITIIGDDLSRAYTNAEGLSKRADYSQYLAWSREQEAASRQYWISYLTGLSPCRLPTFASSDALPAPSEICYIDATFDDVDMVHNFCRQSGVEVADFIQVAWAIVLRRLTASESIAFGYMYSGRDAFPGAEDIVGPLLSSLVRRFELSLDTKVSALLEKAKADLANGVAHCAYSLASVQGSLGLGSDALFNTVLSIQHELPNNQTVEESLFRIVPVAIDDHPDCAVSVNVRLSKQVMRVRLAYQQMQIPMEFASEILEILDTVIWNLAQAVDNASVESIIGDCWPPSTYELNLIQTWNAKAPHTIKGTFHDRFRQAASRNPLAPALCFGDYEMSYAELNALSDRLASELYSRRGIRAEQIVPFLCEKGPEAVIYMLAIMKAGGAFLSLDVEHPDERIGQMLRHLEKPTILAHTSTAARARTLTTGKVISYDIESIERLPARAPPSSLVDAAQLAYCTCASGSAGSPKAVLVQHSNIVTSLTSSMEHLGITYETRLYQISSLASDASIVEILQPLLAGGCVCLATKQEDISDIEDAITRTRANFVYLTPDLAEVLSPARASTLGTVILRGDAVTAEAVQRWHGNARLMSCYGAAETAAINSCSDISISHISNIGSPIGCRYWVVDSNNHHQLCPVSHPGELLIQGPCVARGYNNDAMKTPEHFIAAPEWVKSMPGIGERSQPFYKTGDIVVQSGDGSIEYIDRKDRQVKLRGLPIELSKIESQLRKLTGADWHVVVELIHPKQQSEDPFLAVFMARAGKIVLASQASAPDHALPPLPKIARRLHKMLVTVVPSYVVPKIFIPVRALRLDTAGKIDRKRLQAMAEAMTADHILRYNLHTAARRNTSISTTMSLRAWEDNKETLPPAAPSDAEVKLRQLWSSILSIPQSSIGPDSEWTSLGGDSLKVIKLVSAAREQGLAITVADIFLAPRLDQISKLALSRSRVADPTQEKKEVAPFTLLGVPVDVARAEAARLCGVHISQIEDIYPCTPLQKTLLASSSRRRSAAVRQNRLQLHPEISVGHLQRAWARVVEETQILRTRIVDIPGQGLSQVVVDEPVYWLQCDSASVQFTPELHLGSSLNRAGIHVDSESVSLIWAAHQAVYDEWALPLFLENLEHFYFKETHQPLQPYRNFVNHVSNVTHEKEQSAVYWRNQFAGSEAPQWPALPSPSYEPLVDSELRHEIGNIAQPSRFTLPTAIRAAWATLISQYTGVRESTFGAVVNGRLADVDGIERIAGPVSTTVPVRVTVDPQFSTSDLLGQVQEQAAAMIRWEQTGLIDIEQCSPEAKLACHFQSLLSIEPAEQQISDFVQRSRLFSGVELLDHPSRASRGMSTGVALILECKQIDGGLKLHFSFDSTVITESAILGIAKQFEVVLRKLCDKSKAYFRMSTVMSPGEGDLAQIWKWNATAPPLVEECVHHMLKPVFAKRASSPALHARDGTLTYGQLDAVTNKLARHLIELGVRPNTNIPLFFEKSLWCPVAALAVMKAGATSIMLDVSQPKEHIQAILKQVKPGLALTSSKQAASTREITSVPLINITGEHLDEIVLENGEDNFELVTPSDILYIAFQSGSAVPPKGVLITHANFCSAMHYQANHMGLHENSRVIDVSADASDITWYNLLHTLYAGGCLCIPNNDWGNDISRAVLELNANFLSTTPTTADSLEIEALRNLDCIEISGEKPDAALLNKLKNSVKRVRNIYSVTECAVTALSSNNPQHPSQIGVGAGLVPWVVDPVSKELVPVGCVGELWLEGPLVAKGYLNNVKESSEVFVDAPNWLRNGSSTCAGRRSRMYRTGDLVRYEDDGSLSIIGRRKCKVGIQEQKSRLDEVEGCSKGGLSTSGGASVEVSVQGVPQRENEEATWLLI
ncbi:hypothetical protein CERZMDRAFT_100681 [Cercospora zeae-maydis SCOH1-5]|uniref:Carrier domain-containing protein n=1 Tax=Cercospora zeae-maydis SCOH1-5 TaxID=717836 RepID=A0A6A6F737_9PEZI|nr:hypothetical protein CERZMDRAFT_100681 [Cercospora zeae-maydis SCOH1-5]